MALQKEEQENMKRKYKDLATSDLHFTVRQIREVMRSNIKHGAKKEVSSGLALLKEIRHELKARTRDTMKPAARKRRKRR